MSLHHFAPQIFAGAAGGCDAMQCDAMQRHKRGRHYKSPRCFGDKESNNNPGIEKLSSFFNVIKIWGMNKQILFDLGNYHPFLTLKGVLKPVS